MTIQQGNKMSGFLRQVSRQSSLGAVRVASSALNGAAKPLPRGFSLLHPAVLSWTFLLLHPDIRFRFRFRFFFVVIGVCVRVCRRLDSLVQR